MKYLNQDKSNKLTLNSPNNPDICVENLVANEWLTPVLCIGLNPAFQTTLHFEEFKPFKVNRAFRKCHSIGGKGQNFAMACEQYECAGKVTVLQFVGGITGSYIDAALTEKGIKHINVEVPRPTRTCTTVLCRATNSMTELIEPSAQIDCASRDELEKIAVHLLTSSKGTLLECIALCGTLPPGITGQTYTSIVLHKPPNVLVFMDAAQEVQVLETGMIDILKVNAEEAALIAGLGEHETDILKIGKILLRTFSLKVLAITNGSGEAFLFENSVKSVRRSTSSLDRAASCRSSSDFKPPLPLGTPVDIKTREFQSFTSVPSSPSTLIGPQVSVPLSQPDSERKQKNGVRRTFSVSERSYRSSPHSVPQSAHVFDSAEEIASSEQRVKFQDRSIGSLGSSDLFSSVDEPLAQAPQPPALRSTGTGRFVGLSNRVDELDVTGGAPTVSRFILPDIQSLIAGLKSTDPLKTATPEIFSDYLPSPTLSEAPKWGRAASSSSSKPVLGTSVLDVVQTSLNPLGAGDTCSGVFVMAYLQSNRTDAKNAFRKGLAAASASCLMLDHTAHFDRRVMELISDNITIEPLNK